MKIIISPAKKMQVDTDSFIPLSQPLFLEQTQQLLEYLRSLSFEELKDLWKCSDKLATENYQNLLEMNLDGNLTPALLAYVGIQYQTMAPEVFSQVQFDYVQKYLRILSGFYGVLAPFDGVVPYRLEMQAKVKLNDSKDLYALWADRLYQVLYEDDDCVLNLASKEYSKAIERYVKPDQKFVTCVFGELKDGKVKQKATAAKMARGQMVQFLARKQIQDLAQAKEFNELGYRFLPEKSSQTEYVFVK
ncbi:peroxide stress protein YaaA [Ligilactobacillus sp. Marseille-Q7487]|jgi:cytoplasmic iron level regulating protein YaaA (DUF328/UPF0246 family)|uniref:peroxide stress protein YaaA n=1 Tax=Ligilactobacillus sp. Marseille-Q7487 TaxID=3022128 RepID=UPI0015B5DCFC|nr:peroxide stress protein YaaA [Ligilactobacillus sp. Marseille-Q7487]